MRLDLKECEAMYDGRIAKLWAIQYTDLHCGFQIHSLPFKSTDHPLSPRSSAAAQLKLSQARMRNFHAFDQARIMNNVGVDHRTKIHSPTARQSLSMQAEDSMTHTPG